MKIIYDGVMVAISVCIGLLILAAIWFLVFTPNAAAQTPPVSTITDLPDTVTTMEFSFQVTVESDIPWDQGGIGFYYRIPDVTGWLYIPELSGTTELFVSWLAPNDNTHYELSTQVTDNDGNAEEYHQIKAAFYVCTACSQEDCPPPTVLGSVQVIAEFNPSAVSVEVLTVEWYWLLATTGTPAVSHTMFYEIITQVGDTVQAIFPGLTRMDSLYGYADTPYPTAGERVRASVAGVDSLDRMGPESIPSTWFGDDGPPGQPGQVFKRVVNR